MNNRMYKNYLIAYYLLTNIKKDIPVEHEQAIDTIINYLRTSIANYKLRSSKLKEFVPSSLSVDEILSRTYFVLNCLKESEYLEEATIISGYVKKLIINNKVMEGELKR